ncbi:MAG: penicillin-binding protein 2 [Nitrospirae bacterium]|nr:MAG: penicillin-binding protein 2 [Nitrospirota bacterium]
MCGEKWIWFRWGMNWRSCRRKSWRLSANKRPCGFSCHSSWLLSLLPGRQRGAWVWGRRGPVNWCGLLSLIQLARKREVSRLPGPTTLRERTSMSRNLQTSRNIQDSGIRRQTLVSLCMLAGFVIIFGRLFYLQVLQADKMREQAARQHYKILTMDSPRGPIVDRHGKPLALTVERPSVYASPSVISNPRHVAQQLADVLQLSSASLMRRLQTTRSFVWIKRHITPEQAAQIRALALEGVGLLMEPHRQYPQGLLLSHVLGFAGVDSQGLEGLEKQYDAYLRGQAKTAILLKDAHGHAIRPMVVKQRVGPAGYTLQLTIDEMVQYIIEEALEHAMDRTRAKGGVIIVMDPKSGEILGWALRPAFDPNRPLAADPTWRRNRGVTDPYEPGSTLKVLVAAAAIEEGKVEPGTLMYAGDGQMPVSGTIIHDTHKAGWVTFAQAVERSSNIAAVKTALLLKEEGLYHYLKAFGLGERTEIDVPGESAGLLKPPRQWGSRTLASVAIGQEIGVTPIQLITAVAAVANQGWLMRPYVVRAILDAQGTMVWEQSPQVRQRPISGKTARILTTLLVNAVEKGTGKLAAIPGYQVAGKTGTAQKFDLTTGRYSTTRHISSFVGFVPASDPRIIALVIVDEPQGPAWGGRIAAPIFREVAERILQYLKVPPHVHDAPLTVAMAHHEDPVQSSLSKEQ